MKKIWRGLCLAVLLVGLISFPHIHKRAIGSQIQDKTFTFNDAEPAESFVAESVDSRVDPSGKVTVTGSRTRYVKANGEWREVIRRQSNPDAPSQQPERIAVYGGTLDGIYEKKNNSAYRRYVSDSADQHMLQVFRSHNYLRNHPEFCTNRAGRGSHHLCFKNRSKSSCKSGRMDREGLFSENRTQSTTNNHPLS